MNIPTRGRVRAALRGATARLAALAAIAVLAAGATISSSVPAMAAPSNAVVPPPTCDIGIGGPSDFAGAFVRWTSLVNCNTTEFIEPALILSDLSGGGQVSRAAVPTTATTFVPLQDTGAQDGCGCLPTNQLNLFPGHHYEIEAVANIFDVNGNLWGTNPRQMGPGCVNFQSYGLCATWADFELTTSGQIISLPSPPPYGSNF